MYGERIRKLRKDAGLNQADLADMIGVSRPNISFWEKAQYPPLEAVTKVCRALNVEVWEFFLTEEVKAKLSGINPEVMELIERLSRIETGSLSDVLEIFYVILSKFDKSAETGMMRSTDYMPELIYQKEDSPLFEDGKNAAQDMPLHRLPFNARHAGKIALEHYFNNLLWISN